MKTILSICMILIIGNCFSQVPFNNHRDSAFYFPISYSHSYDYTRVRISKLNFGVQTGTISSFSLFIDSVNAVYDTIPLRYKIYILEDSIIFSNFRTTYADLVDSATLVFDDTLNFNSSMDSSWLDIPFQTNYNYTGENLNIIFESVNTNNIQVDSNLISFRYHRRLSAGPFFGSPSLTEIWKSNGTAPVDSGTVYYLLPNYKIGISTTDSCNDFTEYIPYIYSDPEEFAMGDTVLFCLDPAPLALGLTYNWQYGPVGPGGPWMNIPNSNSACITMAISESSFVLNYGVGCSGYPGSSVGGVTFFPTIVSKTNINSKSHLDIYPNPSHNCIKVVFPENSNSEYKLYSTDGSIVKSGKIKSGDHIYIDSLKSGIYFLNVYCHESSYWKKLIID